MKFFYLILLGLLVGCANKAVKQETGIAPLVDVITKVKQGMSIDEVNKILAGNKPSLQFTTMDKSRSLWEFHDRNTIEKTNMLEDRHATILFDNQAKVLNSSTEFCLLPDQEPPLANAPRTSCYQKHLFPFEKQLTYDAIKRFLIISNYQVEHSDAASEIISANGTHSVEGEKDKTMFIKLTIIFTAKENNSTEVVMSASFSISEKQSTWVQAGFAGVVIPVPLPFQQKEEWINTGIVTPRFYLNFYDALSELIAREYLVYQEPKASIVPITTPVISNPNADKPKESVEKKIESNPLPEFKGSIDSAVNLEKVQNNKTNQNESLPEFNGAIDSESNLKKVQTIEVNNNTNNTLPDIKGAIDSESNLNQLTQPIDSEVIENVEQSASKKKGKKAKK